MPLADDVRRPEPDIGASRVTGRFWPVAERDTALSVRTFDVTGRPTPLFTSIGCQRATSEFKRQRKRHGYAPYEKCIAIETALTAKKVFLNLPKMLAQKILSQRNVTIS